MPGGGVLGRILTMVASLSFSNNGKVPRTAA
jgi:hypothetical protein